MFDRHCIVQSKKVTLILLLCQLFDCLKFTLTEPIRSKTGQTLHRAGDDLAAKLAEHKREEIKVGAKVFLNANSVEHLSAAVEHLLDTLSVSSLDNLILAYHPPASPANGHTNGKANGQSTTNGSAAKEGELSYSGEALVQLQLLWSVLEQYAEAGKICQLGIADLDTASLQKLWTAATVKPTIAQINLSACCVVPPSLQEFCTANEIQLLTHSDPEGELDMCVYVSPDELTELSFAEVVPRSALADLQLAEFQHSWTSRYQVHVRCRGVLAAKGFIVGVERQ